MGKSKCEFLVDASFLGRFAQQIEAERGFLMRRAGLGEEAPFRAWVESGVGQVDALCPLS